MIQTLNQHIKLFSDFATNHKQVNSFGFGDAWEWYEKLKGDGEKLVYPSMFVAPGNSVLQEGLHYREYTFFFCDLLRHAEQNENDALSDMELVALDFITFLVKGSVGAQSGAKNATLTPFTERGTDYVVGYEVTIQLRQQFEYEDCAIPMTTIDTSYVSCQPGTVLLNGAFYNTVASGGTLNVIGGGGSGGDINVYIDGLLVDTVTTADYSTETLNIEWN